MVAPPTACRRRRVAGWGGVHCKSKTMGNRAEVKAETEPLFFAPWAYLNESELEGLASLARQLREGLKK